MKRIGFIYTEHLIVQDLSLRQKPEKSDSSPVCIQPGTKEYE